MKLYYSPGACSLGIHVLLEEAGASYEGQKLDFSARQHLSPEFKSVNPKGKVPVLELDDGRVITEFSAVALFIAREYPEAALIPVDVDGEVRAIEALDYLVGTVHMQGFTRVFRPGNFTPRVEDHEVVKARGTEIYESGLGHFESRLEGRDYILGAFSIADAALFYLEFWVVERLGGSLSQNLAAHYSRIRERPAVRAALAADGFGT